MGTVEVFNLIYKEVFITPFQRPVVCSQHFKLDDYKWSSGTMQLKPGSVPSVFPWNDYEFFKRTMMENTSSPRY